ncbi:SDR family oxidoreductase [Kitasatospora sp. NPDC093679]|uniref:SDR family NAD(P)-dependent oxidoreductase n=1 Tax=Kitasatospora sp. NPDC093679 TaxID=3154983 RepID=UPI003443E38B
MEAADVRILVAGATGALGSAVAVLAAERGARVVPAGRDPHRLEQVAGRLGSPAMLRFDAYDSDGCTRLAARAADRLGGLDAVLVTSGTVAFGPAERTSAVIEEHLMAVNALAPMAVLRGALAVIGPGGAVGAITAAIVDRPVKGMAAYQASKAALSAWLDAVRTEQRRNRISVLDARLPHLDTGLVDRAVAGTPPPTPPGADLSAWVAALLEGMISGASVLMPHPVHGAPTLRR